jgi:hypothetical protein
MEYIHIYAYIVSIYGNAATKHPVQLLYSNTNFKNKNKIKYLPEKIQCCEKNLLSCPAKTSDKKIICSTLSYLK